MFFIIFAIQALDTLSTVAPLCLEDYMTCQSNTRLLLLLEWCVGQGMSCQAVSCWKRELKRLENISPSQDPISTQKIIKLTMSRKVEISTLNILENSRVDIWPHLVWRARENRNEGVMRDDRNFDGVMRD